MDTTQKRTKLAIGSADGMVSIAAVTSHKAVSRCHSNWSSAVYDAGTVERRPTQVHQLTLCDIVHCLDFDKLSCSSGAGYQHLSGWGL